MNLKTNYNIMLKAVGLLKHKGYVVNTAIDVLNVIETYNLDLSMFPFPEKTLSDLRTAIYRGDYDISPDIKIVNNSIERCNKNDLKSSIDILQLQGQNLENNLDKFLTLDDQWEQLSNEKLTKYIK